MDDIQVGRRNRLKEFQNALNVKQIELARLLKTNPGFISQMLTGNRKITESFAYSISKRYDWFNPDWLISGNGTMRKAEGSMILPYSDDTVDKLNEPVAVYEKAGNETEPFEMLRIWKESFEDRMRKLEAEVERMSGLLEGEGKGGA
jgi:transcriptional regulator with XRE-family HTH domain